MRIDLVDGIKIELIDFNRWSLMVHIFVRPDLRGTYARDILRYTLKHIFDNTEKTKLITIIPKSLRHVILFGYQMGFVKEGTLSNFSDDKQEDSVILCYNRPKESE